MIELLNYINNFQKLDSETEQAVLSLFVEEKFKKDDLLVEAGKICSKVYFIKSGFVRRYIINNEEETTVWFYGHNQMTTSMPSFFGQKPAYEYLQACEDTIVYSVNYQNDQKLLDEYPLFAKFHMKQLRYFLAGVDEVNYRFNLMTAKEKYIAMLAFVPEILQKAKLKHVASFLDISQETLSRIRASII
jgi:cAMP-binding proteins - catabolite gene activator and regulatory subunit of cAMP-dependent protein kinases